MKRIKVIGLFALFLAVLIILPLASAEISISQPKSIYSVGNSFLFNVTLISSVSTNNFLIAKIVCSEVNETKENEIYKISQSIESGKQKTIDISGKFDNFLVGELGGTCHLNVKYGTTEANTKDFKLTRGISVNVLMDKIIFNPGDRIDISGNAIKENGESVEKGFVELRINELGITSFKTIENGKFNLVFDIADDSPAGDYDVNIKVYEKDGDGIITNEGESATRIKINQVIKNSDVAISSQNVVPGNDFVYTTLLYDQSGKEIIENVEINIYKPNKELFSNKILKTGEANTLTIDSNYVPGNWEIELKLNEISAKKTFYVEELEKISYELLNKTLVVKNAGNVPYEKIVEIEVGSEKLTQKISLDVGEIKRYALSAPDGEYSIKINDGENIETIGTIFLTGNAINVRQEGASFWSKSYIILWAILIIFGILIALNQYAKISNRAYTGRTPSSDFVSVSTASAPASLNIKPNKDNIINDGMREECSIIALKLKNNEQIEGSKGGAMETIERALTRARDARAKVYADKNYKTIIFAPSLTKEKDNSMKAVSIAREIETMLLEHNKRFGEKIMFGIGVHNGEMILENVGGNLKFNAIGNTMPYTKKIADSINSGMGVSEFVHRRILGKVKSDKIEGTNYWRISKIREKEIHSDFINKFLERQKEGKGFF